MKTLMAYWLIDPGSEWRLHRQWYEQTAMNDLLGEDFGLVSKDKPYRCLDKLIAHKTELFSFLQHRWEALFQAAFDVLLYDLTSTYFESAPPDSGKRRFGYSRDKPADGVGQDGSDADGRCAFAHHRWTNGRARPVYPARAGPGGPAAADEDASSGPAATPDCRSKCSCSGMSGRPVVLTL